jgi:peptide/nickel transport system substrate-binding protein
MMAMALSYIPAAADENPKYGGILTYVIPADAPPSFDGHRETTFATIHSAAPFYSVLIRVDPNNDRFRLRSVHRDAAADRQR